MQKIISSHKYHWRQKDFLFSIFTGLIFLSASFIINHFASAYSDRTAGSAVNDILLDNLPVVNVNFIVNDVALAFIAFVGLLLILKPARLPFVIKNIAIFIFIRSIFITLTHLGSIPQHSFLSPHDLLSGIAGGSDMFFSGHTGMPFLLALIFWEDKFVRFILLAASVIFGVAMILGHLHYSIDVFAAFFISYGIYNIAKNIFPYEYATFHKID